MIVVIKLYIISRALTPRIPRRLSSFFPEFDGVDAKGSNERLVKNSALKIRFVKNHHREFQNTRVRTYSVYERKQIETKQK